MIITARIVGNDSIAKRILQRRTYCTGIRCRVIMQGIDGLIDTIINFLLYDIIFCINIG